ncbi:putative glutamine-dependent NAD(+) synthetase [Orchesella cincta]|uniref:Glutamine-dependent NAD(+) synthetase n=1 Tax=Orchesella cincta TaxID=48709 RepID=A0A1D2N9H2_ORCCI|nr:putative glutamine-dependent NAD(+) synthetase [Orchesella cincta]
MTEVATLSTVTLNQFVLDFEGNKRRILESIKICKAERSRFRCGPELEICGYNCQDHFYERDTQTHSWEVLVDLLKDVNCQDILIDVGMPVMHNGVNYNCRVVFLNKKILLIRPKMIMCDDANYRESRWFTGWTKKRHVEDHMLPEIIAAVAGQRTAPFGDALLQLTDTKIGFEICEELWNPMSTHLEQTLAGADIIVNGSGSHAEIRKAFYAMELIKTASAKCGCLYAFSNLRGCDGERVYLNGCSTIVLNGEVLKLGKQYALDDVEVLTATFQLDEIHAHKVKIRSRSLVGANTESYPCIETPWSLSVSTKHRNLTLPMEKVEFVCPEEEIASGPALWLWDYLRRSPASGFFLPLSGGVDSASVAIIVYSMCRLIVDHINTHDDHVLKDVQKVLRDPTYKPTDPRELCGKLFTTCYMASDNSSETTRNFAQALAVGIGSNHRVISISNVCSTFVETTAEALGKEKPTFEGTREENLALQNVQARSRMVFAYMFAQLTPWSRGENGFLLVLTSANVDEAIRGYFTKYDCSSGDLNPIGGISKTDLKRFIIYASQKFGLHMVEQIVEAPPTAELCPLKENQTDEEDMGMTYKELSCYGKLRKPLACGPYSMMAKLIHLWNDQEPRDIAKKVKHFYRSYAANRHKMSILTPSCHMEDYSPEDHRHDLRPIFYPLDFTWQFQRIDDLVNNLESEVD